METPVFFSSTQKNRWNSQHERASTPHIHTHTHSHTHIHTHMHATATTTTLKHRQTFIINVPSHFMQSYLFIYLYWKNVKSELRHVKTLKIETKKFPTYPKLFILFHFNQTLNENMCKVYLIMLNSFLNGYGLLISLRFLNLKDWPNFLGKFANLKTNQA